jgi:hypothetical protein
MMGMAVGKMLVAGAEVVRKWLVAPESRMAHHLIMSASVVIVLRSNEAARAYLQEGVKQGRLKLTSVFILLYLTLLAPNHQKCEGCGYGL